MTHIPDVLRRFVKKRANGCCEYCRLRDGDNFFPHEIDHIIAEKHTGETAAENLCLSCIDCNRRKGSDLTSIDPETRQIIPLFNPRQDRWAAHFGFDGALIVPLTPTGRVTTQLLGFNDERRVDRRLELIKTGDYPCGIEGAN